jgi:hypothetical protein
MAKLSKTAEAAQKAINRGEKRDTKPRTWPDVLKDIRNNLNSGLAVTPGDIRQLLHQYEEAMLVIHNAAVAQAPFAD